LADEGATILCVDDEVTPLTLRKCVLEKSGFQVLTAASANEALERIQVEHVDLVLTDLLMPGISGTELAREIKRLQPKLPVVLLSGVNEIPEDANHADFFLSKLEGPVALCNKISEILNSSRETRS